MCALSMGSYTCTRTYDPPLRNREPPQALKIHLGPPSRQSGDSPVAVVVQTCVGPGAFPSSALEVLGARPSELILESIPGSGSPMPPAFGLPRRSAWTMGAGMGWRVEAAQLFKGTSS